MIQEKELIYYHIDEDDIELNDITVNYRDNETEEVVEEEKENNDS